MNILATAPFYTTDQIMESIHLLSRSSVADDELTERPAKPRWVVGTSKTVKHALAFLYKTIYRRITSSRLNRTHHKVRSSRNRGYCCKSTIYLAIAIAVFILLSTINALVRPLYSRTPPHYGILRQRVLSSTVSGRGNVNNEKIFIAANIIDEQLIRGPWGQSVIELIDILGEDNVFISIYENDSGPGTRDALLELQQRLTCNSSVVTGGHLPLSSFPTVTLPDGEERVQRITYLAEVRNRLLRPLDPTFTFDQTPGFRSATHTPFSKVLFLNDIYFSPLSAAHLLFSTNADPDNNSNNRTRYRAACAIDFVRNVMFYDSFVVRDFEGYGMGLMFYPYFATTGNAISRSGVRQQTDAVRVRSCWGGMAAFDAAIFQNQAATHSSLFGSAVTFRGSNELFWEAAECCLLFADIEARLGPPSPENGTGVFINPFIRVAYTSTTWAWLPFFQRFEGIFEYLQYIVSSIGYPEFNPRRNHEPGMVVQEQVWVSDTDLAKNGSFKQITRKASPGGFCGQRRLFVMKQDLEKANTHGHGKNWEKIVVPHSEN